MECKICESAISKICETTVLGKYQVSYYQCNSCEFIQTENPHWFNEAYSSAITTLDIGLLNRNIVLRNVVPKVIETLFDRSAHFIDYGGGYGVLVRMLRDKGYQFYLYDTFCENLFAKHFDISENEKAQKYELLTAFEVFEHLENPKEELRKMLSYSTNIFFTTELIPNGPISPGDWWYVAPETGQHISFYSTKSLGHLAMEYDLYYCNYSNYHLFTKKKIGRNTLKKIILYKSIFEKIVAKLSSQKSLLQTDYELILSKLRNENRS